MWQKASGMLSDAELWLFRAGGEREGVITFHLTQESSQIFNITCEELHYMGSNHIHSTEGID